jgi:uncharacterized protein (TIGR03000 family)
MVATLAATVVLLTGGEAWAGRRGCGGGRHGHGGGGCGGGGCGGGGCGGGGYHGGGCGGGGCGGHASYGYGGGCAGGMCAVGGGGGHAVMAAVQPSQATMIVSLPAEAKLTVDGKATTSTTETRVLVSPPLEGGKDFVYTLRAEVTRNGQTQSVTREVIVRAGQETRVTLEMPTAVAAR